MNGYSDIVNYFCQKLEDVYPVDECRNLAFWSIDSVLGLSRSEFLMNKNGQLSADQLEVFENIIIQLLSHKPIQYILGECDFYNLTFQVNSNCLIPRPETEELVHWVLQEHATSILDIGTGSGCIAISLAKNSSAKVSAIDISEKALTLAKHNADLNQALVNFIQANILESIHDLPKYDLIVSNPPYVLESEKVVMNDKVLNYEPHLALFVEDDDSLIFYDKIIDFSVSHLNVGGQLFFEINEQKANDIAQLLEMKSFENILIKKDMQGKERMIKADLKL